MPNRIIAHFSTVLLGRKKVISSHDSIENTLIVAKAKLAIPTNRVQIIDTIDSIDLFDAIPSIISYLGGNDKFKEYRPIFTFNMIFQYCSILIFSIGLLALSIVLQGVDS